MLITAIIAPTSMAKAADFDYTTMSTNGSWYESYIDDYNTVDYYKITIPSDGTVTIKLMYYMNWIYYTLYNSDLSSSIERANPNGGSSSSPVTKTYEYDLSEGTYYIKIEKDGNRTGKYKINSKFISFGNNENEPNDYEHAMNLESNTTITGGLTIQDEVDWFKIYIPDRCNINIKLSSYINWIYYTLYNSDLSTMIESANPNGGTFSSPITKTYEYTLAKGTYYIKIQKDGNRTGKYKLSWNYNIKVSKPSNLKVSTRKTTSLKLSWSKVNGASGYQLQRKSGDTWKTLTNTTSTSYTVKNLSAGKAQYFRVRAYKTVSGKKYYSSWKTLTTATKPSTPSIKTPSTNKKHQIIVKWNKVSSCSGYQVQYSNKSNFSKVIATKTVSGNSKTSYTGKNFTKGKTYYVRVRSYKTVNGTKYYSSWSKVKSIKSK